VPTGTLALLAQRLGEVFASASTWYRLVRQRGWRRPRRRVHPPKPKVGVRASAPNELWHVDTSLLRLVDGTRAYLYAVIDNSSRRILAWRVSDRFDPLNTVAILVEANAGGPTTDSPPSVVTDAGVENINAAVDELIDSGALRRVLAQWDVTYSNSMIEAWWRTLKPGKRPRFWIRWASTIGRKRQLARSNGTWGVLTFAPKTRYSVC